KQRYWVVNDSEGSIFSTLFRNLSGGKKAVPTNFTLGTRQLKLRGKTESTIWCDYADLCEQPFSALDYIKLCDGVKNIMLSKLPALDSRSAQKHIARGTEDAVQQVKVGDRQMSLLSQQ